MAITDPVLSDRFAADLVRRGLPSDYAQRAALELSDHRHDLVAELCDAGLDEVAASTEASRRLGDARTLAKKTVREYQGRFWYGRRPLLTFLLGPIVLVVASFVAIVMLAYCIFWPLEQLGIRLDQSPDGIRSASESVGKIVSQVLFLFVGPAVSLLILARLARKAALGSVWLWLSTSILTVIASCTWCGFAGDTAKNLPADQGVLMFGLPWLKFAHDPMYVAQFLLPLAIGALMTVRMRQRSLRAELKFLGSDTQGGSHDFAKCA